LRLRDAGKDYRQHPVRFALVGGFGGHRYGVDERDDVAEADVGANRAAVLGTRADAGERVAADEARFLDSSRARSCVVSDYVTTG
jgi:hypothetical protein